MTRDDAVVGLITLGLFLMGMACGYILGAVQWGNMP